MKQFFCVGALAVALAAVPTQQASAWTKFQFSTGITFAWEGGGNNLLWGAWQSAAPDGSVPGCQGNNCGFGNRHGGGGQQYMYTFPTNPYAAQYGYAPQYGHQQQGQQAFPPQPSTDGKDNKGKQDETNYQNQYQNQSYPNLGYSIYQPTGYHNYQNYYYQPTFRFDQ